MIRRPQSDLEAGKIAHAVGQDAGNASMRRAGRKRWNEEDWNTAVDAAGQILAAWELSK